MDTEAVVASIFSLLIIAADFFGLKIWSFVTEQWVIAALAVLTPVFYMLFKGSDSPSNTTR